MSEYDQLIIGCTRSKRGQSESVMFRNESVAEGTYDQQGNICERKHTNHREGPPASSQQE